ncbi:membrane protein [Microtetraspora sp. NBRC 13810]|uniref:acyltransferase family protein n=1 Tax=Microtetraspora sp. NBRC 13810 TaxID=3030990 RepID=UPI0024A141F3|nr:acyltransferase family protein [Microtetraspora sp. NBRC 13810]GLW05384.1 membrane protein [Microtetraspora sp. NBRC 13810]
MSETRSPFQIPGPRSDGAPGAPASPPAAGKEGPAAWPPPQPPGERQGAAWGERTPEEAGRERGDRPGTRGAAVETAERPETARRQEPAAPAPRRRRDPYLDNVKFVLIALVPIGHSLVPTLAADSARSLYIFVYVFHMPAFVLISGYLSRNFWHSNAKINKLVDTLLVPFAVVEVGYAVLRFALGQKWSLTITDPAWLNWYLLALFLWRISTPLWTRMKQPLLVAVVIYLAAGFSEISGDFSIDRFFGLLPFYVLGLMLKPEHFEMLNRTWVKILGVVTLAGAAAVAILIAPGQSLAPFYYKNSYAAMDMSWWMGLSTRMGLLVAALAMTAAVLALVPRKETWYSDLGTRTLYAYLLHGVPVLIAKDQGWLDFPWLYGPLGALAISASCFALAILLCMPITRTAFKWMLEPRLTWLYRRSAKQ